MSDADPPKPTTKRPRPKYQVFISSTFEDLHEVRRETTWEILKAGHIPAGMENFPAADDRGWKTIQRTIDRSDYYVVVVAGMYGSVDADTELSWTQREYRYAKDRMPVLAFVRQDEHITKDKAEKDPDKQIKLDAFKKELRDAHHCEHWGDVADLRARVAQAVHRHIQDDEDEGTARPGWYRGDEVPVSATALEEFARLSAENDQLKRTLAKLEKGEVEALDLLWSDGAPIGDLAASCKAVRVVEDRAEGGMNAMFLAMSMMDRPPLEEVQAYADDVERTVWCDMKVFNKGTKPARRIVADFWITNAKVFIDSIPKPQPASLPEIAENRWCFDAKEHVYVEGIKRTGTVMAVKQRVALVGVGGSETLINIGVRPLLHEASVRYE